MCCMKPFFGLFFISFPPSTAPDASAVPRRPVTPWGRVPQRRDRLLTSISGSVVAFLGSAASPNVTRGLSSRPQFGLTHLKQNQTPPGRAKGPGLGVVLPVDTRIIPFHPKTSSLLVCIPLMLSVQFPRLKTPLLCYFFVVFR